MARIEEEAQARLMRVLAAFRGDWFTGRAEVAIVFEEMRAAPDGAIARAYFAEAAVKAAALALSTLSELTGADIADVELAIDRALQELASVSAPLPPRDGEIGLATARRRVRSDHGCAAVAPLPPPRTRDDSDAYDEEA